MNGGKAKLPVVGDYVKYVYNAMGESLVYEVVERKNVLKRPDQSGHAMGFVKTMLEQDIVGYAIALYAHDDVACKAFWQYGFGRRCIDLIRKLEQWVRLLTRTFLLKNYF